MDSADPLARRCPFLPSRFPVRLKRTPTPSGGGPVFRQGHTSTYAPLLEPPNKLKGAVIYLKGSKAHVLMHQLGVLSRARLHLFQKLPHLQNGTSAALTRGCSVCHLWTRGISVNGNWLEMLVSGPTPHLACLVVSDSAAPWRAAHQALSLQLLIRPLAH